MSSKISGKSIPLKSIRFLILVPVALLFTYCGAFLFFALGTVPLLAIGTLLSLMGIIPLFLAILITMIGSHCRSRVIGLLLGAVLSSLFLIEATHLRMVKDIGPEAHRRYDLIPSYLHIRMQNTYYVPLMESSIGETPERTPTAVDTVFNWGLFAIVHGIIFAGSVAAGYAAASKAYCDSCRKWQKRDQIELSIEALPFLSGEINTDQLEKALALHTGNDPGELDFNGLSTPTVNMTVEYCDREHRKPDECHVYLTVEYGPKNRLRRKLFKRIQIGRNLVEMLVRKFPGLK